MKLVLILLIAFTVTACASPLRSAQAQSSSKSYYDRNGSFAGSAIQRGNNTTFYDSRGRYSGTELRRGNSRTFYDHQGRFSGSAIDLRR